MGVEAIRDGFDRIVEKQELVTSEYHKLIDKIGDEIQQAITDIQSSDSDSDHKSVINNLKHNLAIYNYPQEQLKKSQKERNEIFFQYSEILRKFVYTDKPIPVFEVEFDLQIVNQIIINLLYHEGRFDVADILINEAQESEETEDLISLRCKFSEMHQILDELKGGNLEPALNWVLANRRSSISNLEFDLRRLQFLEILKENKSDAIEFAKIHLSPFASTHKNEFLKLMGCFLSPGKLETSELLSPEKWAAVSHEFMVQFCGSMGMSGKNPLAVTVEAGEQVLTTLLKLSETTEWEIWPDTTKKSVEVELGREFQFHTVFVCPVTTEHSDDDNPAMLLPCRHVLCSQTISKLDKNNRGVFKCPFCPVEMPVDRCRRLYF